MHPLERIERLRTAQSEMFRIASSTLFRVTHAAETIRLHAVQVTVYLFIHTGQGGTVADMEKDGQ